MVDPSVLAPLVIMKLVQVNAAVENRLAIRIKNSFFIALDFLANLIK